MKLYIKGICDQEKYEKIFNYVDNERKIIFDNKTLIIFFDNKNELDETKKLLEYCGERYEIYQDNIFSTISSFFDYNYSNDIYLETNLIPFIPLELARNISKYMKDSKLSKLIYEDFENPKNASYVGYEDHDNLDDYYYNENNYITWKNNKVKCKSLDILKNMSKFIMVKHLSKNFFDIKDLFEEILNNIKKITLTKSIYFNIFRIIPINKTNSSLTMLYAYFHKNKHDFSYDFYCIKMVHTINTTL